MTSLSPFAETIFRRTYAFTETETWDQCANRVSKFVANGDVDLEKEFFKVISTRKFIPGGRYLYSAGRELPQTTNCMLLYAKDSREGWAELLQKHVMALCTGGGVGTYYGDIRPKGTPIKKYGGTASGPISLMKMINEVARHVMAGGKRRSALWSGLPWWHGDIEEFIVAKNWPTSIRALKEKDFSFPADMDMMNISVCLDDKFFREIKKDEKAQDLYYRICKQMVRTGEPGFSIDTGKHKDEVMRNACTEIVSDSKELGDVCNLGSINFGKIESLDELEEVTHIATKFLYKGTSIGWMPHPDFDEIRKKNRRLGLGFMGLHEWLIKNGFSYETNGKLGRWLSAWQQVSDDTASSFSEKLGTPRPVAVRAVAPTGTISIIGEASGGIEPIFCVAYKRRWIDGDSGKTKYMYVVDPTAKRLIEAGINPDSIEDCYDLSIKVEKRIEMQAFVQDYVDNAISSTINLPEYGEYGNNNVKKFSETLLKYLPRLRGITCYPENSRAGQPITKIKFETAIKHKDVVFEEGNECTTGVCGI